MGKFEDALSFSATLCSVSEQCSYDIKRKIEKFELTSEEVTLLVKKLKKDGFLDEERYVGAFVNDRFKYNKWGKIKITYLLKQKGIESSIIYDCLESIEDEVYFSTLYDLIKHKQKVTKGKDKSDIRNKLYRFAAGRGFESKIIISCLKKLNFDEDEKNMEGY